MLRRVCRCRPRWTPPQRGVATQTTTSKQFREQHPRGAYTTARTVGGGTVLQWEPMGDPLTGLEGFGDAVALSGDGNRLIVGTPDGYDETQYFDYNEAAFAGEVRGWVQVYQWDKVELGQIMEQMVIMVLLL